MKSAPLSRPLMLMCLGTGLVLLGFGGQQLPAALSRVELPKFQLPTPKPSPSPAAATDSKLVVDLSDRKVSLFKQGKLQTKFPIAIGKEGWETPTGSFRISQKYQNPAWEHPITHEKIPPGSDRNPLGKWWIGFTMKGKLAIGFHGTQSEELVGEAVSHGCLRMKNADIEKLVRQVEVGTVVEVKR